MWETTFCIAKNYVNLSLSKFKDCQSDFNTKSIPYF